MLKWLILANATAAQVYDITYKNIRPKDAIVKVFAHSKGRLKNGELVTDKPGDFHVREEGSGGKFTKDNSPHTMELNYFAEELAHFLEHARTQNHYTQLVVCMDPHFYGIFEKHLKKEVQKLIINYLPRNYLTLSKNDLEKVVAEIQHEPS